MTISEFVQDLRERCDAAAVRGAADGDIVAAYIAPSGGFLGRQFRPRLLEDRGAEGRYGVTFDQGRRLLTLLRGERPPKRVA